MELTLLCDVLPSYFSRRRYEEKKHLDEDQADCVNSSDRLQP